MFAAALRLRGRALACSRPSIKFNIFALFFVALAMSGCAAKLVPDYEKALVDELTKANQDAMTLFAAVSTGAPKATFPKRESAYNSAIGEFNAISIQLATRPVPQVSPVVVQILTVVQGKADLNGTQLTAPPSIASVQAIVGTLTTMRDTDKAQGLHPMLVDGFRREYEISIEQALAYEKNLER